MRFNKTFILILLLIATIVALAIAIWMPFTTNVASLDFMIKDTNHNDQYEVGEQLGFIINDTTAFKNRKMVWEFGNGDSLVRAKNVNYSYDKKGKYLVTLKLDDKFKIPKYIDIIGVDKNTALDSVPKIYGVDKGYVNEQLVFSTNSPGVSSWSWEFGETGTVDGYEKQVVYIYKKPGIYTIKLTTNRSKYPVYHRIEVAPMFQRIASIPIDSISIVQNDIKVRLQAIADASIRNKSVYYNSLRHIERKYKCKEDEMVIIVNSGKYNDLYSYCQGLHHLEGRGSKSIEINEVKVDTIHCIKRVEVTQSIINQ